MVKIRHAYQFSKSEQKPITIDYIRLITAELKLTDQERNGMNERKSTHTHCCLERRRGEMYGDIPHKYANCLIQTNDCYYFPFHSYDFSMT